MKKFNKILLALMIPVLALLFSSCAEDVITIDLNSVSPKIVIEGKVIEGNQTQTVKITKTVDFFKPGDFPPVSGAVVKIGDDSGNTEILTETDPGLYTTDKITGVTGRTYTMTVESGNKIYRASSFMNSPSQIDSLSFEEESGQSETYIIHCYFTDKKDIKEYLRFNLFINGEHFDHYFVYQDRLTDGKNLDLEFWVDEELNNGDVIIVQMDTIDRPVYEFFNTLSDALISLSDGSGNPFASTPGNPISNISDDALGYFSAFTATYDTLIVQK